jgi:hypothetical protein
MNFFQLFRVLSLAFAISSVFSVYGQSNLKLKTELDSIYYIDQLYREIMMSPQRKDSLAKAEKLTSKAVQQRIFDKMNQIDSANIKRIKQIINQYGYPGKSLVGEPTNEATWYVVQHSKNIAEFFPMIEQAGKSEELPFRLVAMMQDRLLMYQGKEQVYGTQARCDNLPATATNTQKPDCYIWPILDPIHVNERRKQAGFSTTVEENAKRLNVEYKVRSLPKK